MYSSLPSRSSGSMPSISSSVVVLGAAVLLTIGGCTEEKVEEKAAISTKEKEDLTDCRVVPESMVEPRLRQRGRRV